MQLLDTYTSVSGKCIIESPTADNLVFIFFSPSSTHTGSLCAEDGEGVQRLRQMEPHLPLQQPWEECGAEVCGFSAETV